MAHAWLWWSLRGKDDAQVVSMRQLSILNDTYVKNTLKEKNIAAKNQQEKTMPLHISVCMSNTIA